MGSKRAPRSAPGKPPSPTAEQLHSQFSLNLKRLHLNVALDEVFTSQSDTLLRAIWCPNGFSLLDLVGLEPIGGEPCCGETNVSVTTSGSNASTSIQDAQSSSDQSAGAWPQVPWTISE